MLARITNLHALVGRALPAVALAALLSAGCAQGDDGSSAAVARLTQEVKEAQRQNKALMDRLDRIERRVDGHSEDIDRLSRSRVAEELAANAAVAAAGGGQEGEAAIGAAPTAGMPADLARLLETEDGVAAVEKAMQSIQEKRDAERRERWVGAMIDRFAEQANLTAAQTEDMRRIVGTSFQKINAVWASMRDAGDMSPEERATLREDNMQKMEEIRQTTNDEVKAILSADQFTIYEEQAQRMRGFGGPDRGGPGGRGR